MHCVLLQNPVQQKDHRNREKQNAPAMKHVPLFVLLPPSCGQCAALKDGDAVVNRHQRDDGVDDDRNPDARGNQQRSQRGFMPAHIRLDQHEDERQGVPPGHRFAQSPGEETQDFRLRMIFQPPDDGIDEGRYGKFGADHETHAKNRKYVEIVHEVTPSDLLFLIHIFRILMQMDVLTNLSVSSCDPLPVSKKELSQCPIDAMLSVMDGRWKGTILWRLCDGPLRTSELRRSIPGITERLLIRDLQELVRGGVI